jgi:hypothetical protein
MCNFSMSFDNFFFRLNQRREIFWESVNHLINQPVKQSWSNVAFEEIFEPKIYTLLLFLPFKMMESSFQISLLEPCECALQVQTSGYVM